MDKAEVKQARSRLEDVVPRLAPFVIYLDPCGACNFKCSFCPCNTVGEQAEERHKMMSWELFEKLLNDLQTFQGQVSVINLHGFGEPLLNPRIADMVKALKQAHCCREVRITTNGSLLDEAKSRALIDAGVDIVRVSVEALSTEEYKNLCGVQIEFSDILRNVKTFYHLTHTAGTSKISAKIFSDTLRGAEDKKRFYELFAPITDYHYVETVEPIWSEFGGCQTTPESEAVPDHCYRMGERREICSFPFTDMCIHSNGIVGTCCSDWKFATQYGDARTETLSEIWNGRRHRAIQRAHLEMKLNSFCAACRRRSPDQIENPELLIKRVMKE